MWDAVWLVLRALSFQDKIKNWLCHPTQSLSLWHSFLRRKQVSSWHFVRVYAGLVLPHFSSPSLVPDTHLRVPTLGSSLPFSCHTYALFLFPLLSLESREKRHKLPSSIPTVNRPDSWGQSDLVRVAQTVNSGPWHWSTGFLHHATLPSFAGLWLPNSYIMTCLDHSTTSLTSIRTWEEGKDFPSILVHASQWNWRWSFPLPSEDVVRGLSWNLRTPVKCTHT